MKKLFLLTPLFLLLSSFSTSEFISSKTNLSPKTAIVKPADEKTALQRFAEIKVKDFEKLTGKKLSLKQKIAFKLLQLKARKQLKDQGETKHSKGQTAFVLSLIGLCLLIVPYAAIASLPLAIIGLVMGSQAKKENPGDKKASTAVILSLVTLGLIVLAVLLVIALIASGGFWVY